MKVNVGSKNNAKLEAVKESLKAYERLAQAEVMGLDVSSGVSEQPLSLEETVQGAINRAKAAFRDCDYSIGLESGLMAVPQSKSGHLDFCACAIYDGTEIALGFSSAWEFPDPKMMDLVSKQGLTMTEAAHKAGLSDDPELGAKEGIVAIMTKRRLTRKEYTKQALTMALIHLDT